MFKKLLFPFFFWLALILLTVFYNDFGRIALPKASGIGRVDDLSIALFLLGSIVFFLSFKHFFSKILIVFISLGLSFFAIINWWFYDFYRDYVAFSVYKLAAYSGESALAWEGLKYKKEAFVFLLLIFVMLMLIFWLSKYKPRKKWMQIIALGITLLGVQKQFEVSKVAIGGNKHKAVNHVSYFVKSALPQDKIIISDEHIMATKNALDRNNIGSIDPLFPLYRYVSHEGNKTAKKNVILIVLESIRSLETGLYDSTAESITPNLKKLSNESLHFSQMYANSNQTVRGELAILCSALDYVSGAPYSMSGQNIKTNCLPSILKENGYDTYWIHGYEKSFFNRDEFFPKIGFNHLLDIADLDPDNKKEKIGWGLSDEELFLYAFKFLEEKKKPFFAEILTLSNHYPYEWDWGIEFPDKLQNNSNSEKNSSLYSAYKRGVYYTDNALGQFIKNFKESDLYDNTLLVITGDHGIWTFSDQLLNNENMSAELVKSEIYFRLPLVFYAKDLPEKVIHSPVSQVDIAPSILDYLNINYFSAFMGHSILRNNDSDSEPVFFNAAGSFGFRKGSKYCYPIDTTHECEEKYNRSCKAERGLGKESLCVAYDDDLLNLNKELTLIKKDQSSERMFIDLSQHYLEYGFMPKKALINQQR